MTLVEKIVAWPWRDNGSHSRVVTLGRKLLRVLLIVGREFKRDQIPLRAGALAFTVLLSLVPVLALGTAVMKGFGGDNHLRATAHQLIDRIESQAKPAAPVAEAIAPPSLTSHLHRAVDQVFVYVERTNFATLGTIGIIGVLWAALSVLGNIERAMNAIWHSRRQRGIFRRIVDYLALTMLMPLSINIGLAAMTAIESPKLKGFLLILIPDQVLLARILSLLPVALLILTFSTLYAFLPNTRVKRGAATIGGVVGALGWLAFQAAYLKLQFGVARYNAIYGSFATLPLFFLWVYVGWMVFLTGAEVSFAVQNHGTYHWHSQSSSPLVRLRLAIEILHAADRAFEKRKGVRPFEIVQATGAQDGEVREILDLLHARRLLVREKDLFFPAAPIEKIPLSEVSGLILGEPEPDDTPSGRIFEAINRACEGINIKGRPLELKKEENK